MLKNRNHKQYFNKHDLYIPQTASKCIHTSGNGKMLRYPKHCICAYRLCVYVCVIHLRNHKVRFRILRLLSVECPQPLASCLPITTSIRYCGFPVAFGTCGHPSLAQNLCPHSATSITAVPWAGSGYPGDSACPCTRPREETRASPGRGLRVVWEGNATVF